ncbi:hypothetical protein [Geobacillus thermodenitrificans]|uniref:hypothetical protein n=1 Tax=Geobacillus thermodenitrificans TaxID=33940 RepID=UPI0029391409|nr:hypothetical protein [Geobacillus thermodenitrificans]
MRCFENFLVQHGYSVQLHDITKTHVRRFIQHQMTKEHVKPRTIYRRDTPKTDSKLTTTGMRRSEIVELLVEQKKKGVVTPLPSMVIPFHFHDLHLC